METYPIRGLSVMSRVRSISVVVLTLAVAAAIELEWPTALALSQAGGVAQRQTSKAANQPACPQGQLAQPVDRGQSAEDAGASDDEKESQASQAAEEITLQDGRLSMHVRDRSLVSLLEHISAMQRDVTVVVKDGRIDRPVTATFEAAPLDVALRALLCDEDVLMLYGSRGQARSVLKAVIVYPAGHGDDLLADVGQDIGTIERLRSALDSPDEAERGYAVQSLIERFGTQAEESVLRALDDPSDHVRELALYGALESAFTLPVDTLTRLAITDAVPSVRRYAMEALGSNVEGTDAAERLSTIAAVASSDPDTSVRERAARIYEQLTRARARPDR
jgi:hypothetical protein